MAATLKAKLTGDARPVDPGTVTIPSEVTEGDLITVLVGKRYNSGVAPTITGYSLIGQDGTGDGTSGEGIFLLAKIAEAGESTSVTIDRDERVSWEVRVYGGSFAPVSNAVFSSDVNGGTTATEDHPSVTVGSEGGIIEIALVDASSIDLFNVSTPANFTDLTVFNGTDVDLYNDVDLDAASGTQGPFTTSFDAIASVAYCTVTFPFAAGGPSITSVTDHDTTADQITEGQNATIQLSEADTVTVAELQNSAGTRTATLPIQSSTSSSVTVQGARGALRYGDTDNKVVLTLDDASTIEATGITFAAPALTTWANGTAADTTSDNSLTQGMGSVPSDYQIAFTDDGVGDPINPVINSDTTVASVENPGTGVAELYDNADGTWGPEATYELALDTTVTLIARGLRKSLVLKSLRNSLRKPI